MADVVSLAEMLHAPVLTTFKAKGQIPDQHPLAAGVLGRSGTPVASWFMNECDLILAFGSSFSNHTGITPKKPIIQVDFDQMALGKFHPVTVPVWGEIGAFCAAVRRAERQRAVGRREGNNHRVAAGVDVADRDGVSVAGREDTATGRSDSQPQFKN